MILPLPPLGGRRNDDGAADRHGGHLMRMIDGSRRLLRALTLTCCVAPSLSRDAHPQSTPAEWPRIEVSVAARRLAVVTEVGDTLYRASVAVGSGRTLQADGRRWVFRTPRGRTWVSGKDVAPAWVPPDWHFIEQARTRRLGIARLFADQPVPVGGGRILVVRGQEVGIAGPDSLFRPWPPNEELVFGDTLYIPPFGTRNRSRDGILGPFRLRLANGIGLHGTPDKASIGKAATHGCIRLHDEDIAWLHANIPVGTRVVIR